MEEWKDLKEYEGLYEISNYGRIKSLDKLSYLEPYDKKPFYRRKKGCMIKLPDDKNGYKIFSFYKDKKKTTFKIHQLVLGHFDRKRKDGEVCRHLDGDVKNNHISNLKWGTIKENADDMIKQGNDTRGEKNAKAKLNNGEVLLIKRILLKMPKIQRSYIARMFKVKRGTIQNIINGHTWSWLNETI